MLEGEDSRAGKDVFHRQVWELPVNQPRPGRIAPGSYEASFDAILPPTYPSSSETKGGRVTYLVEAKLRRRWSLDVIELQRIWYSATSLSLLPLAQPIMTVGSCAGVWRDALPYSIIIPSETLFLGQLVPVTIRLGPLLANSPVAGQAIRLINPRLRLKQYADLTTSSGNSTAVRKKVVVDLTLAHWPKIAVVEYQNTVLMQLPMLPELVPTTRTTVYSVRHSLNLMVGIAMSGLAGVMKVKGVCVCESICVSIYILSGTRCFLLLNTHVVIFLILFSQGEHHWTSPAIRTHGTTRAGQAGDYR